MTLKRVLLSALLAGSIAAPLSAEQTPEQIEKVVIKRLLKAGKLSLHAAQAVAGGFMSASFVKEQFGQKYSDRVFLLGAELFTLTTLFCGLNGLYNEPEIKKQVQALQTYIKEKTAQPAVQ